MFTFMVIFRCIFIFIFIFIFILIFICLHLWLSLDVYTCVCVSTMNSCIDMRIDTHFAVGILMLPVVSPVFMAQEQQRSEVWWQPRGRWHLRVFPAVGVSYNGGIQQWMVFSWQICLKWMMTGATPI